MDERQGGGRMQWKGGIAWLIGLAALLLYACTAAPGIVELYDDSLEFQLVAPTFGIAHPTGYPLYGLLGGLWSRLFFPFGNWAWRMNLFSALAGAGSVALLFLLAKRLTGGNSWGGLAAVLAFAFGPVWWAQTTVAEVYALHNFLVAALLYTAVALPGGQPTSRQISLLGALAGLSLTHHRTAALILPGLALYLLWTQPGLRRPQSRWLVWAAVFLAPLLLYLYLPLRAAMGVADLEGDYVNSWAGFWRHVLASGYTSFFADNPLAVTRSGADWLALALAQFGWPTLALGVAGLTLGALRRGQRAGWRLIWITLLTNLLFALSYRVGDVEVFLLPVFLCLALGVGQGVRLLADWIPPIRWGSDQCAWARWLLLALLLFSIAAGIGGRGAAVNRSQDWDAHTYALALASVDFPPDSRVVGLRGQMSALQFMQASAGMAANAQAVALDNPDARRAFVVESVASGLPVYLTQEVAGIEDTFSFGGDGVLVRVWPRGQAQPGAPSRAIDIALADGQLRLTGYDLHMLSYPGEPTLRAVFYWLPTVQLSQRLKLSLRLLDGNEEVIRAEDRYPLRQVASTTAWLPGEIVRDVYDLPRSAAAVALLAIVYDEATVTEVGRVVLPLP